MVPGVTRGFVAPGVQDGSGSAPRMWQVVAGADVSVDAGLEGGCLREAGSSNDRTRGIGGPRGRRIDDGRDPDDDDHDDGEREQRLQSPVRRLRVAAFAFVPAGAGLADAASSAITAPWILRRSAIARGVDASSSPRSIAARMRRSDAASSLDCDIGLIVGRTRPQELECAR